MPMCDKPRLDPILITRGAPKNSVLANLIRRYSAKPSQAGVSADQVIHVGDCHNNDVSGAILAGAKAIWFNPEGSVSEIASGVVQTLSDLPDAIERLAG
jgi:phosphoglycolate phosphatase-like HAD superfamily hydrolase